MAYGGWKMDENGTLRWCVTVRQALSGGYADIMRIDDSDSSLAPDPSPGRWFCVELYWHRDVSQGPPSNGEVLSAGAELYVDGIMACSSSNLTYSNPVSTVQFGLAETYGVGPATIYIDSCAIDACRLGIIDYVPPEPSNLSITGRIYYSTYPLDGVRVELFEGNSQSLPLQSVLTIDGFYSFSGVAPGSYDITAYGPTSEFLTYATYYDTVISSNVTKDFYLSKIITVHSPLNQANITSLHPTISWETNKEASRYNIQINVLDGTQLGEIVENGICTSTSYKVINELTPGLRYWLHIGAADALSHEVGSNLWTTFTVVRPERDLSISILTPGNTFTSTTIVNTTIQNLGLSNESDIVVQFFVNGSLATSKTITFLENASSTVLSAR